MATSQELKDLLAMQVAQSRRNNRGKKYSRPPVVPEITKAYQQDPRTRLAVQALATGSSTAPVAEGKYAFADGIARALTGVAGGYINKQQQNRYGPDEDAYIEEDKGLPAIERARLAETAAAEAAAKGTVPAPAPVPPAVPPAAAAAMPPPGGPPGAAMADPVALALNGAQGGQPPAPGPMGGIPGTPPFPVRSPARRALPNGSVLSGGSGDDTLAGGELNLAGGRDALLALGAKINSGYRTKAEQQALIAKWKANGSKGVRPADNSFHNRGTEESPLAYDFGVGKSGLSMKQLEAKAREAYPGYDVINEGDHIHVEPSAAMAGGRGTATRDTSGNAVPGPPALPGGEENTLLPTPEIAARPTRPEAVKARRSELLNAAYDVMELGNPYKTERAQRMHEAGLAEQGKFNEAAAEREQALLSDEFGAGNARWQQSANNAEGNVYATNQAILNDRRGSREKALDRAATAQQGALDRASMERRTAVSSAGGSDYGLTPEESAALSLAADQKKLDIVKLTRFQAKEVARALVRNPDLNPMQLHALATIQASPTAQTRAMNLEVLPEVAANLREVGKKLNFSDVRSIGKLQAFVKGELNDPLYTEYMNNRNDTMLLVAGALRGQVTDLSTRMESEAASPTMSPQAWDGWYKGQITAAMPRIRILERRGMIDAGTADKIQSTIDASGGAPTPGASKDPTRSTW